MDYKHYGKYRILSWGREDGIHRSEVALILGQKEHKSLFGYEPINDRLITARFRTKTGAVTICQVYVPPIEADESEVDKFYKVLQGILKMVLLENMDMDNATTGEND